MSNIQFDSANLTQGKSLRGIKWDKGNIHNLLSIRCVVDNIINFM